MTILAWRIVSERRAHAAFTGEGASRYPGRWNMQGTPLIYTAGSLALAVLEIIANTSVKYLRTQRYVAVPIRFDEKVVLRLDLKDLPADWAQAPRSQATQALGTRWVTAASSAVLAVPSSIIPIEPNFLLNPRHPDFCKISIGKPETFLFDKRLLR